MFLICSSHDEAFRGKGFVVRMLVQGRAISGCMIMVCSLFVQWLTGESLFWDWPTPQRAMLAP